MFLLREKCLPHHRSLRSAAVCHFCVSISQKLITCSIRLVKQSHESVTSCVGKPTSRAERPSSKKFSVVVVVNNIENATQSSISYPRLEIYTIGHKCRPSVYVRARLTTLDKNGQTRSVAPSWVSVRADTSLFCLSVGHVGRGFRLHVDGPKSWPLHGHCATRPVFCRRPQIQIGHHLFGSHLDHLARFGFAGRSIFSLVEATWSADTVRGTAGWRQWNTNWTHPSRNSYLLPVSSGIRHRLSKNGGLGPLSCSLLSASPHYWYLLRHHGSPPPPQVSISISLSIVDQYKSIKPWVWRRLCISIVYELFRAKQLSHLLDTDILRPKKRLLTRFDYLDVVKCLSFVYATVWVSLSAKKCWPDTLT